MPVTKECRCCGRPMVFTEAALSVCPACGTHNARPRLEGVMLDNFRRAIRQQADRDFYNAEISYQYVLNSCPEEPEALWSRLLCHYGAVFVNDGGVRRWEIHMTRSTPLQEQGDYRLACELAEPSIREQYEADAAYIDNAMARIRELAQTCPPYDVFLCHKTTVIDGPGYTEDFRRANDLYRLLTAKGLRVFFAPVVLEGTAGEDYEAGIFHALDTAKVMLVVCSDLQHLTSLWVQSEWKRYLERVDRGEDARVIPLMYGDMGENRLPQEFRSRRLQAIRMELNGKEVLLKAVDRYIKKRKGGRPLLSLLLLLALVAGGCFVYQQLQPEKRDGDRSAAVPQVMHASSQYQYEKSAPVVTPCPHYIREPEYGVTKYRQKDSNSHYCITPVNIRCENCDALTDQHDEQVTEAHTYKFGSSTCSLCGYTKLEPTPTTPRTTKTWEVYWSDAGVSSHDPGVTGPHVGGVDEGPYPNKWEKGRTRFPVGQVICFRGTLLGNGSQQDIQLRWRVRYDGVTVTGDLFKGSSTADSSFVVWTRSQKRGSYRLEIYYFKGNDIHIIGQYEYVLD